MWWVWLAVGAFVGAFVGRFSKLHATHKLARRLEDIIKQMEKLKNARFDGGTLVIEADTKQARETIAQLRVAVEHLGWTVKEVSGLTTGQITHMVKCLERRAEMRKAQIYERDDGSGEFDWRLIEPQNGQIIATSGGQGYKNRAECEGMFAKVVGAGVEGVEVEVCQGTGDAERVDMRYTLRIEEEVTLRMKQKPL